MEKIGRLQEYDKTMQEQLQERVIDPIPEQPTKEVIHYVPHQAVIRDEVERTKPLIVHDCSAKENSQQASLNDCLKTKPSFQPLLFNILMRNIIRYFFITGYIEKAFFTDTYQQTRSLCTSHSLVWRLEFERNQRISLH